MSSDKPAEAMAEDVSINQVTNLQNQNVKLLQIFPEEIWLKVFGLLTELEDLQNLCNASPFFQNFLGPQRCFFLFPKVFKVIDSKHPLPCNDILNLRLVSHFWKFIVESTIQSRKSRYNFLYDTDEFLDTPEELLNTFQDSTALSIHKGGHRHLDKLWTGLAGPFYGPRSSLEPRVQRKFTWSPVPSRHIIICDKHIPNQPENPDNMAVGGYRHPTFALLVRLGVIDVVWFMDIWIRYSTGPRLWYSFVNNWVRDAPNLKVLQFKYPYEGIPEEIRETEREVASYPFEHLPNLVMLTLDDVPKPVTESALTANSHIEMLQILRSNPRIPFDVRTELLNSLTNLHKFSVSLFRELEFQLFEQVSWPNLKTLYLNLELLTLDWNRLFGALEKFKNLNDLTLKLPNVKKEQANDKVKDFSLPSLKQLKVSMQRLAAVDFLQNLTSLKDLYFVINIQTDYVQKQEIKLHGYYDCLETSNIWDKVPSLRKIRLAIKTKENSNYCRHTYEKNHFGIVKTR